MKAWKIFCLVTLVVAAYFNTVSPQAIQAESGIRLETLVDRTEVPLNRTLTCTIRLRWFGNLDRYDIHHFDNPLVENLEIIANASANKVANEDGQNIAVQEYEYTLKPKSLGMAYIEGVVIQYTDTVSNAEYRLDTKRMEVKISDPIPEPGSKAWIIYAVLAVAALALATVCFVLVQRKKASRKLQEQQAAAVALPLEEQYLQTLKDNVDLNDPDLDLDQSYSFLTKMLRRFLNEKFQAPGLEATTNDVLKALEGFNLENRFVNEIREILTQSDMVKFSGAKIEKSDVERTTVLVEAILQKSLRGEIAK